jgi:inhibitor of cysteine peptidase
MKHAVWSLVLFFSLPCGFCAEQKPVSVAAGQEFKLTLESNPSTGNQWLLARPLDERLLKYLGSEYRRRSGAPGAPGAEVLSFRALAEGKTDIRLKYGRLFESDSSPARKTNFVVVISHGTVAR